MHNGTAVLTSINNVKSGMAINAEPNPEMPWTIPDKKKMNAIRIKVIMSNLIIKLLQHGVETGTCVYYIKTIQSW
jgi:hypothetical protein